MSNNKTSLVGLISVLGTAAWGLSAILIRAEAEFGITITDTERHVLFWLLVGGLAVSAGGKFLLGLFAKDK
jgi:hypothetical protein